MKYMGDYADDSTVRIFFTTNDGSGGAVAPSTAFEAADIVIYKNNSATQKATTNGITMTSPFDTVTGLHLVEIDCSNDTGDAGFWATGNDYSVVLSPDETVDSQTVVAAIAQFSIENRVVSAVSGNVAGIAGTINTLDALDTAQDSQHSTTQSAISALNNFDPAADTVANVTTVGSVSGSVGSVVASVTAGTVTDKTGYSISGTLTTLDALDAQQDAQHSTTQSDISALNNFNPASDQVIVATNNDKTGYALSSAANDAIGAAFLSYTLTKGSPGTIERAFWQSLKTQALTDGEVSGTPGVSAFDTNLTATTGAYDHLLLMFTSGALAGEARPIDTYVSTNGRITLQEALTAAPSSSDEFIIVPDHTDPISDIQSGLATSAALAVVDSNIDAILADTGTDGVVLSSATLQSIATTLLDLSAGVESNRTLRQALRLILSASVGKLSGAATETVIIRDSNDSVNRITATVDGDGNRTSVTLNAS